MSHTQNAAAAVTELKVSGHLMVLDPGLFCVSSGSGSGVPDPRTGLPGVRVSTAPGKGRYEGAVTLSGISDDGWLAGTEDAVLVRVTGGPAQIMVTVYRSVDGTEEAPKLQVIRLGAPPPGPAAAIEAAAHIYGRGDVAGTLGGWTGERGSKRWIEGFGLQPSAIPLTDLEYQAVLGRGWLSPWTEGGQFCGSRGMSLPILGLRVRLRGASAEFYAVSVSATFVDGTAVGPITSGEPCEAPSLAALEAFCVSFDRKDAAPPAKPRAARSGKARG